MVYEEVGKTYEELTGLPASRVGAHGVVQRFGEKQVVKEAGAKYKAIKGDGKEHVGSDGTMVNIRGEGWKEVKVGAYYKTNEEREKEEVRYVATAGSRAEIGRQLYELAGRPTLEHTEEMAFISDGAEWLEELREEHFPKSTGIVDFYHVSEYVGNLGRAFFEDGRNEEWIRKKLSQIKDGGVKAVEQTFNKMKARTVEQKEALEDTCRYLKNHDHKMKYDEYSEKGFHIGSGVIEAGCKHVIGTRFKRTGMRWSRKGAENLLALRVSYLNGDWDEMCLAMKN
jgi:hypothetical protein